jgi:hypothetical protein
MIDTRSRTNKPGPPLRATGSVEAAPAQLATRLRSRDDIGAGDAHHGPKRRRVAQEADAASLPPRAASLLGLARQPATLSACDRLLADVLSRAATKEHAASVNAPLTFRATLARAADVCRRAYRGEDLSLLMHRALETTQIQEALSGVCAHSNAEPARDAAARAMREAMLDAIEAIDRMPHCDLADEEVNHLFRVIEYGDFDVHALKEMLAARASLDARRRHAREPTVLTEVPLDAARTAFVPDLKTGLSDEQARAQILRDRYLGNAVVVHHPMEHLPRMDRVFPLRDPLNPLDRVHPRFAGARGRLHANVAVQAVHLPHATRKVMAQLNDDARLLPPDEAGHAARMSDAQLKCIFRVLQQDLREQISSLVGHDAGNQPSPRCRPRVLRAEDVQPHERMLIGQHGLFVHERYHDAEATARPLLCNGRSLGIYAGALLDGGERQLEEVGLRVPGCAHYALTAREARGDKAAVIYHALGAGNSMAMANTALLPGAGRPAYDMTRINALFLRFDVCLTDKTGEPATTPVMVVAALGNLFSAANPQRQVYLDYGPSYLSLFESAN